MRSSDRETAELAAPRAERGVSLCASVLVGRAFVVELPPAGSVTIGRDPDVDLQISDGSVSRQHVTFPITQADCDHEGNRSKGRDRVFVTWKNASGSTEITSISATATELAPARPRRARRRPS